MTWHFDLNNAYASGQPGGDSTGGALFRLKTLLTANGWTCRGSGDGLAAYEDIDDATGGAGTGPGGAYDVITQESGWGGGAAGDQGNENAWYRLREPTGTREWVFQRHSAFESFGQGEGRINIVFSRTGFLTPGSATARPTATDEQVLVSSAGVWGDSDTYSQAINVHVGMNDAQVQNAYPWFMLLTQQAAGTTKAIAIYDGVDGGIPSDGEAWWFKNGGGAAHADFNNVQGYRDYGGGAQAFVTNYSLIGLKTSGNTQVAPGGTPVGDDGSARVWPIPIWQSSSQQLRGFASSVKWKGAARSWPDTQDLAGINPRVYVDDILLPWEQNTVPAA